MRGAEDRTADAAGVRAVVEIAVWCAVLVGVTVVSISSVGPVELAVAGGAALGGAFAARAIRLAVGSSPSGVHGALRTVLLLPGAVVRGCLQLARTVLGPPAGRRETGSESGSASGSASGDDTHPGGPGFRRIELRAGAGAGWAGLALAASPDTCVIRAYGAEAVEAHTLRPEPNAVERVVARGSEAQ